MNQPLGLQQTLAGLFAQAPQSEERALTPYATISQGVRVGYEEAGNVTLMLPEKRAGHSPEICESGLFLSYRPPSSWFTLEFDLARSEFASATKVQFGVYAKVSRFVPCRATIRLQQAVGWIDSELARFELREGENLVNISNPFVLSGMETADSNKRPVLLLFFDDPARPLRVWLDYLIIYFA